MVDLGALPGEFQHSVAEDINNHGHIVGHTGAAPTLSSRAFLWTPNSPNASTGTMTDLNDFLHPTTRRNWTLITATAVNDVGQIVAIGVNGDLRHTFLLTPVIPEPSTLTFGAFCGLLLLNGVPRVRRRGQTT
jgi:probable HAF family extracellular repeat protein